MTAKLTKKTAVVFLKVLFLSMMLSATAIGQDSSLMQKELTPYSKKNKPRIELLAGPSIIYPGGNEFLKDERVIKFGFSGGLGFTRSISSKFQINLNLLYENKGLKAEYEYLNTDVNPPVQEQAIQNITLNYLTFSILPRYTFKGIRFFVGIGPYAGYLLSERIIIETYRNGIMINKSGTRPDPYLNYEKFDLGISNTLGYSIRLNKMNKGNIQFNYNIGLIDINQPVIENVRNNTYSLHLVYMLK